MDKIFKKAIKIGKKLAEKALNECDGTYEGVSEKEIFELEGFKYEAEFDIFWESSNDFDCNVKGLDNNYSRYECCNEF